MNEDLKKIVLSDKDSRDVVDFQKLIMNKKENGYEISEH